MISFSPQQKYHLYLLPTDMRKSFDGLCGIIRNELNRDAVTGEVFLFLNKPRNRIKVLVWDRNGFWVCCKRLEEGVFTIPPFNPEHKEIHLPWDKLQLMLEGIEINNTRFKKRYGRAV